MTETYNTTDTNTEPTPTMWLPRYSVLPSQRGADYTTSLPLNNPESAVETATETKQPHAIVQFILAKQGDAVVVKQM